MKIENPEAYNRLQIEIAKERQPNSEIITYIGADGKIYREPNTSAEYVMIC